MHIFDYFLCIHLIWIQICNSLILKYSLEELKEMRICNLKNNNKLTSFKMLYAEQKENCTKKVNYTTGGSGSPIIYIADVTTSCLRKASLWSNIWRAWWMNLLCWYFFKILLFRFEWCTVNWTCCNILQHLLTSCGRLGSTIIGCIA